MPALADAKPRGLCAAVSKRAKAPYIAVLSAFPAEVKPLVAATEVGSTIELGGRPFYLGRIGRVRVVLGIVGIGMENAKNSATAVLDGLDVAGVIVSGVASTNQRIADVMIADDWVSDRAEGVFPTNVAMLALMRRAQTALPEPLEACTRVPPTSPSGELVCMPFQPAVVLGAHGMSGDPYTGAAACGSGEILGCDLPPAAMLRSSGAVEVVPDVVDMETAAVVGVALGRDVPFLGVRAASDGGGDPRGDRQFPAQFFDYYQLAANNAAIVTRALLASIEDLGKTKGGRRACRLLARHQWERAAARIDK